MQNEPLYEENKEKRALIQEMKNVTNKVFKQNYIHKTTNSDKIILKETYYNSFSAYENNIYILGENDLQFGKKYTLEECLDKLREHSDWINAFILGKKYSDEKENILLFLKFQLI